MAWGRAPAAGGGATSNGTNGVGGAKEGKGEEVAQFVNVVATGSVDLTVKVRSSLFSLPFLAPRVLGVDEFSFSLIP
jgi:hypothetical protein